MLLYNEGRSLKSRHLPSIDGARFCLTSVAARTFSAAGLRLHPDTRNFSFDFNPTWAGGGSGLLVMSVIRLTGPALARRIRGLFLL